MIITAFKGCLNRNVDEGFCHGSVTVEEEIATISVS